MSTTILFILLLVLFLCNTPIAISIAVASIATIAIKGDYSLMVVIQKLFGGADSFHLMAVPLFMYAGLIMEKGGISRRLIDLANALVGWLPGGLAAVTVVSAMFFAGISGSAAADTAAVGALLIPAMKKSGYDSDFAGAVQAAGGSIGVIIPPSIPMIIFGYLTGASIGRLFAAGILPGFMIGLSLIAIATLLSRKYGYGAAVSFSWRSLLGNFVAAIPALGAPIIILGGILGGIFTATESAAAAVFYSMLVGFFIHRELAVRDLSPIFIEGSVIAAIVMFIIATASIFSWVAAIDDIPARLAGSLLNLSDNPVILLLLINLVLLIAGTFVETTAALILLVPMIMTLLPSLGIDPVHLGVIVVTNLAIGMLTPPMGICLIVSASISGGTISAISRRIIPFLVILLVDLLIITFYAPLTTWLPELLIGP
ncbi:MAG: TRAP transporter large permease [Desulfofustis sp.]|nr:TRAP transporter large permease [Desulfofustis sp.]NNF48124.1 TRAP transporter large permease [Desulfofustis sp.]NNK56008.1 TRAP transporter large permease [Desulfofustis sp.]RZW25399.1 MAG: TRAP transporter large permease [Desulfobulbaceae bacterium]